MPPRLRGGAWGFWQPFRRGVSIPPERFLFKHLMGNTQPGAAKFPAVVSFLDRQEAGKVSWGRVQGWSGRLAALKAHIRIRNTQRVALTVKGRRCQLQAVIPRLHSDFPRPPGLARDPSRRGRESYPMPPCSVRPQAAGPWREIPRTVDRTRCDGPSTFAAVLFPPSARTYTRQPTSVRRQLPGYNEDNACSPRIAPDS